MSLQKLFLFFFQHFYCFLQFLQVIFVFIRLPFQSSCLRHQKSGSFRILISFINKTFKFLIKMLIYFLVSLSSISRFCFFASSYFNLEHLADSKSLSICLLFQVSHYRKSCSQLLFDVHLMIQH